MTVLNYNSASLTANSKRDLLAVDAIFVFAVLFQLGVPCCLGGTVVVVVFHTGEGATQCSTSSSRQCASCETLEQTEEIHLNSVEKFPSAVRTYLALFYPFCCSLCFTSSPPPIDIPLTDCTPLSVSCGCWRLFPGRFRQSAESAMWQGRADLSARSYRMLLSQAQVSHKERMKQVSCP